MIVTASPSQRQSGDISESRPSATHAKRNAGSRLSRRPVPLLARTKEPLEPLCTRRTSAQPSPSTNHQAPGRARGQRSGCPFREASAGSSSRDLVTGSAMMQKPRNRPRQAFWCRNRRDRRMRLTRAASTFGRAERWGLAPPSSVRAEEGARPWGRDACRASEARARTAAQASTAARVRVASPASCSWCCP
jgi:hypothetical protein